MKGRLLYLNLAIDSRDTSLGFAIGWIKEVSKIYDEIDVITLRKGTIPNLPANVNIYGPNSHKNKLKKYFYLHKTAKNLINTYKYEKCFSHMSPISLFVLVSQLKRKKIETILWFTHPGPDFGIKKLILFITTKMTKNVITASSTSFPFMSKKVSIIGHAIDLSLFKNQKNNHQFKKFLILSRISRSKNLEVSIDAFLSSDFKSENLDIVGGPLNQKDVRYQSYLKEKYKVYSNVKFIGKVPHEKLPSFIKNYDVNFNSAGRGFFDKSVLETLSAGLINFYHNQDFDSLYLHHSKKYYFTQKEDLTEKINNLKFLNDNDLKELFVILNTNLKEHSLDTLGDRLSKFI